MVKGASNRRAEALARQVMRGDAYNDAWLGQVASPVDFGREVQGIVKKRETKDGFCHSYYVSTLKMPSKTALMRLYDQRGGRKLSNFVMIKTAYISPPAVNANYTPNNP